MRVGRSLIAVLLVAALLVAAVPASAQDEPTPEYEREVLTDGTGDVEGTVTTSNGWADIRSATINESGGDLTFLVEVVDLSDQPDDAFWDLGFTANGTSYTARVRYDGSAYAGEIRSGGAQGAQIGADVTAGAEGSVVQLAWHDHEDELPELATLEDTFAASDQGSAIGGQDCHGDERADCAPDDGFGDPFPLGHTPAEGLEIAVSPTEGSALPNGTVSFRVDVGNGARDFPGFGINLTLEVEHAPVLESTLFDPDLSLAPDETANRTLNVTITGDAEVGRTYEVVVVANPERGVDRTVNASVTVETPPPPPPDHALDVALEPARQTAGRGDERTYNVTVTNEGLLPDIVDVELTAGGEWARLSGHELTLDSGESGTLTLTVRVPDDAAEGEVTHTVTATSRNDPSVSASGSATTEVDLPGGFVNELDRTLHDLGLGGLVPVLVILAILATVILYVAVSAMRRRQVVGVDAGFEDDDED